MVGRFLIYIAVAMCVFISRADAADPQSVIDAINEEVVKNYLTLPKNEIIKGETDQDKMDAAESEAEADTEATHATTDTNTAAATNDTASDAAQKPADNTDKTSTARFEMTPVLNIIQADMQNDPAIMAAFQRLDSGFSEDFSDMILRRAQSFSEKQGWQAVDIVSSVDAGDTVHQSSAGQFVVPLHKGSDVVGGILMKKGE